MIGKEGGGSPVEQHSLLHVSSLPLAPGPTQQTTHLIFPPPPQNTKHYELLNYSEHGTTVDNVLYSCDFSEKTPPTPPSSIVAKVQSVISKLEQRPVATEPALLDTFSDASVRVAVARCHDLLSLAFPVLLARFSLLVGPGKATEKHVLCTPMGIYTYLGSLRVHPSFLSSPHPKSHSVLEWGGAGAPPWLAAQVGLGCSLFLSCDLPLSPRAPPAPETR